MTARELSMLARYMGAYWSSHSLHTPIYGIGTGSKFFFSHSNLISLISLIRSIKNMRWANWGNYLYKAIQWCVNVYCGIQPTLQENPMVCKDEWDIKWIASISKSPRGSKRLNTVIRTRYSSLFFNLNFCFRPIVAFANVHNKYNDFYWGIPLKRATSATRVGAYLAPTPAHVRTPCEMLLKKNKKRMRL